MVSNDMFLGYCLAKGYETEGLSVDAKTKILAEIKQGLRPKPLTASEIYDVVIGLPLGVLRDGYAFHNDNNAYPTWSTCLTDDDPECRVDPDAMEAVYIVDCINYIRDKGRVVIIANNPPVVTVDDWSAADDYLLRALVGVIGKAML